MAGMSNWDYYKNGPVQQQQPPAQGYSPSAGGAYSNYQPNAITYQPQQGGAAPANVTMPGYAQLAQAQQPAQQQPQQPVNNSWQAAYYNQGPMQAYNNQATAVAPKSGPSTSDILAAMAAFQNALPAQVAPINYNMGESAAAAAAFARAKDKVGQASRGAVNSLRDLYAGSGNLGAYNNLAGGVLGAGTEALANQTTQQALQEAARAAEITNLNYQGGITQRGQNVSYLNPLLQLFGMAY